MEKELLSFAKEIHVTGFVGQLKTLEILEFWGFSFKTWDSLKDRHFLIGTKEKSFNFGIFLSRPWIP